MPRGCRLCGSQRRTFAFILHLQGRCAHVSGALSQISPQVVGQQHITDTLQRQVADGQVGHAYLFTGTRGTGKTTCARILAKAVNCEHPVDGAPCNQCAACRGIDDGSLLDVT